MSENQVQDQTTGSDDDEPQVDELTLLKQRARSMGVSHSPNIGVDALKKKISDHLNDRPTTNGDETQEAGSHTEKAVDAATAERMRKAAIRKEMHDKHMKLRRVRISNLNPAKKDLNGEIFTFRNKYLGIVKRFIPFGEATNDGWHVPEVIYKQMKARKFLQVRVREKNGQRLPETKWVPEFAIEELPPLSEDELKKLANSQAAAGNIDR